MHTKTENARMGAQFRTAPTGGHVTATRDGAVAEFGRTPTGAVDVVGVRAASHLVRKLLATPSVAETFTEGSNGRTYALPHAAEALDRLVGRPPAGLPSDEVCAELASQIATAPIATSIDIKAIIAEVIPNADAMQIAATTIAEEADLYGWTVLDVMHGTLAVSRELRFTPSIAELIDGISEARRRILFAKWAASKIPDLRREIADMRRTAWEWAAGRDGQPIFPDPREIAAQLARLPDRDAKMSLWRQLVEGWRSGAGGIPAKELDEMLREFTALVRSAYSRKDDENER